MQSSDLILGIILSILIIWVYSSFNDKEHFTCTMPHTPNWSCNFPKITRFNQCCDGKSPLRETGTWYKNQSNNKCIFYSDNGWAPYDCSKANCTFQNNC